MPEAVGKALTIAAVGLPVMFSVIGLFMLLAKVLLVLFPHEADAATKDH